MNNVNQDDLQAYMAEGRTVFDDYIIESLSGRKGRTETYTVRRKIGNGVQRATVTRITLNSNSEYYEYVRKIRLISEFSASSSNIEGYADTEINTDHALELHEIFLLRENLIPLEEHITHHGMTVMDVLRMGTEISSAFEILRAKGCSYAKIDMKSIHLTRDGIFRLGADGISFSGGISDISGLANLISTLLLSGVSNEMARKKYVFPESGFQTYTELRSELVRLIGSLPAEELKRIVTLPQATLPAEPEKISLTHNRMYLSVAAVAAAILLIFFSYIFKLPQPETPPVLLTYIQISGVPQPDSTLSVDGVLPEGAEYILRWMISDDRDSGFTAIPGQTGINYTILSGDAGKYIVVAAEGTGAYAGTVISPAIYIEKSPEALPEEIRSIKDISGDPRPGGYLATGDTDPPDATVEFRWQISETFSGEFEDIPEATDPAYIPLDKDADRYIRVTASGTGNFSGTVSSQPVRISNSPIYFSSSIEGTPVTGSVLTAGKLMPEGASALFQWQSADRADGEYTDIPGAVSLSYTAAESDAGKFLRVKATGSGRYTGTAFSSPTEQIAPLTIRLEGTLKITGTALPGFSLTASYKAPQGASYVFRWQASGRKDSGYSDISGASGSRFNISQKYAGKYIRVFAEGTGIFYDRIYSSPLYIRIPLKPITSTGSITGTVQVGHTLYAGSILPEEATVKYQWQISPSRGGTYLDIPGAVSDEYSPVRADAWHYLRLKVTGTGSYTGTVYSDPTTVVLLSRIIRGSFVSFGSYNGRPILWQCYQKKPSEVLLVSASILSIKAFDAAESGIAGSGDDFFSRYGKGSWKDSNIREWLNSAAGQPAYSTRPPDAAALQPSYNPYDQEPGFLRNFTLTERAMVLTVINDDVKDKVFLLSAGEIESLFGNNTKRLRYLTSEAQTSSEYSVGSGNLIWLYWTRTAHATFPSFVRAVGTDGIFYDFAANTSIIGILPALWINTDIALYGKGTRNDPYRFR